MRKQVSKVIGCSGLMLIIATFGTLIQIATDGGFGIGKKPDMSDWLMDLGNRDTVLPYN